MPRLAVSLAALLAATITPAAAADWLQDGGGSYRGAFSIEPKDWTELGDEEDGIHVETGLRYWYSMGSQSVQIGTLGGNYETQDTSHIVEGHLRIDDDVTSTYAKAWVGYSAAISGSFDDPNNTDAPISDGHVGYVGADIGWKTFSDGKSNGVGIFAGYQYWNDSPRTTRANFTTVSGGDVLPYDPDTGLITGLPGDSADNNLDLNMLRLGLSGRAKFADGLFDISGEVAAVPYSTISGVMGGAGLASGPPTPLGNPSFVQSSPTEVAGWGYGGMAEVMVGVTPVENLTFRLGGRAWYLQGTADATYSAVTISDPTDSDPAPPAYDTPPTVSEQYYIDTTQPWSLFRYGLLAELTYSF